MYFLGETFREGVVKCKGESPEWESQIELWEDQMWEFITRDWYRDPKDKDKPDPDKDRLNGNT
jgi:hypothetical protein